MKVAFLNSNDQIRINANQSSSVISVNPEGSASPSGGGKILSATTQEWNSRRTLVAQKNTIYVYTDHLQTTDESGNVQDVPGMKVGDGSTYLIDLPFTDDVFVDHVNNNDIHITSAERTFWNNKVRGIVLDDSEDLVLTIY